MKKSFENIEDVWSYIKTTEKELEELRYCISLYERIEDLKRSEIGYWNSEKGEYVEYSVEEIMNGEREDGGTIWMNLDEYTAKHDAFKRALTAIINI